MKSVRVTLGLLAALKAVVMGIHADGDIVFCDSMLLWEQQATHMPSVDVALQAQPLASTKACPHHYTITVTSLECYAASTFETLHRILIRGSICYDLGVTCHKKNDVVVVIILLQTLILLIVNCLLRICIFGQKCARV